MPVAVKRIAITLIGIALLATFVWLLARTHRGAADDDEEAIKTTPPSVVHRPGGEVVVRLTAAELEKAGLRTAPLQPMERTPEATAYGVILDPAPLIALNGEIASAQAALDASRAEFERAKRLHANGQNVSLKSMQAAQAKFRADQARFAQLGQQLADRWGRAIARLSPERRSEMVLGLARRQIAVARVSLPAGQTLASKPRGARVVVLGYEKHPLKTSLVSFAPSVDPSLQGETFLLELKAPDFPLVPGAAVTAYLRSGAPPEEGVILPRSAVVRFNNKAWVYVRLDANDFVRREVSLTVPLAHGWFLPDGLSPGTRVVVTGAETLLSDELGASHRVDED
jgi:hypothetical protein